ncbi:hypothetical protein Mame01_17410 [Microbispora amethystogenes]|nr:hypothetical protein Mame01_17410 [Microbispora amethystogenes]
MERDQPGDHRHPVGRKHAERAPPQVDAYVGASPRAEESGRPGAVEKQAGEYEEDRDAHVAVGDEPGELRVPVHLPGDRGDVQRQHEQRGDRPDSVEGVQMTAVAGDRSRGRVEVDLRGGQN